MPRRRPYPPEFRAEAVRLARAPGHSIARSRAISGSPTNRSGAGLSQADDRLRRGRRPDERRAGASWRRLRRENRTLRIEREILKKAAAFFATETDETR